MRSEELWFDVGIKRYTTVHPHLSASSALWFDVGIKRYTTNLLIKRCKSGCGLM